MVDLVTVLSPHFLRPYRFGAFALVDAGRPDLSVKLLERGFKENPTQWGSRPTSATSPTSTAQAARQQNDLAAARWYEKAAAIPGSPAVSVCASRPSSPAKAGELEKAVVMWGQVYAAGDKYSRQKAVAGLERILPDGQDGAHEGAWRRSTSTMPKAEFEALIAELFKGYE